MAIKIEEIIAYIFGGFIVIEILSLLVSLMFPSVPVVKLGYIFMLLLIFVAVYSVFALAQKRFEIKNAMEFLVILLAAAALTVLIVKIKSLVPQIFSVYFDNAIIQLKSIVPILGG